MQPSASHRVVRDVLPGQHLDASPVREKCSKPGAACHQRSRHSSLLPGAQSPQIQSPPVRLPVHPPLPVARFVCQQQRPFSNRATTHPCRSAYSDRKAPSSCRKPGTARARGRSARTCTKRIRPRSAWPFRARGSPAAAATTSRTLRESDSAVPVARRPPRLLHQSPADSPSDSSMIELGGSTERHGVERGQHSWSLPR